MPHITRGGVSNQLVDPDFIAEPGTPVETAMDAGLPNVNGVDEPDENVDHKPDGQDVDRDRQADDEQPKGNDRAENQPVDAPRKQAPAKKATPARK